MYPKTSSKFLQVKWLMEKPFVHLENSHVYILEYLQYRTLC